MAFVLSQLSPTYFKHFKSYDGMFEIFCNCLSILTKDETMVHVDIFISIFFWEREKNKKQKTKIETNTLRNLRTKLSKKILIEFDEVIKPNTGSCRPGFFLHSYEQALYEEKTIRPGSHFTIY
jgi:hypothetical protein